MTQATHDKQLSGLPEPIVAFIALALETGASHLAAEAHRHAREPDGTCQRAIHKSLCQRLAHHICELQRALSRSSENSQGVINAITILRVLTETLIRERAKQPDKNRDALESWLLSARTKFLMGTKVDALQELEERISSSLRSRHELRRTAATAAPRIVIACLGRFRARIQKEVELRLSTLARQLFMDLEESLGDLGETLPLDSVAGLQVTIDALSSELEAPISPTVIMSVIDRIGLSSQQRIESAAREYLLDGLDGGSRRLVHRIVDEYDDALVEIEQHFCRALDGFLQSATYAVRFADDARADGADSVARARSRIEHWRTIAIQIADRLY